MQEPLIPSDVLDLIATYIDTVAQLEALLLLRRDPGAHWDAQKVARRLYTSENESAEILAHLSERGFLRHAEGSYRYGCLRQELDEAAGKLANLYSRHLIQLTHVIHGKPRLARQFAEAFRFRKER